MFPGESEGCRQCRAVGAWGFPRAAKSPPQKKFPWRNMLLPPLLPLRALSSMRSRLGVHRRNPRRVHESKGHLLACATRPQQNCALAAVKPGVSLLPMCGSARASVAIALQRQRSLALTSRRRPAIDVDI